MEDDSEITLRLQSPTTVPRYNLRKSRDTASILANEEEDIRQPVRKKSSGTKSSEHTSGIYSSNAAKGADCQLL